MYGFRHSIVPKINNYHLPNLHFTIMNYNMFTFYCIIFIKFSKNKSRKLLVLCKIIQKIMRAQPPNPGLGATRPGPCPLE